MKVCCKDIKEKLNNHETLFCYNKFKYMKVIRMDIKVLHQYTKDIRVLYVEDDTAVRESMSELFETYFLELVNATDGVDALEKMAASKEYFDLIISDISMPRMNGIEMAKNILSENPEVPIIFISAYNDLDYLQSAIDMGISSFLAKPLDKEKLDNAIFKASQIISEHKFVLSHMDLIEDLNFQLESQNKELQKKNEELEKSLRLLDTIVTKKQIIHTKKEVKTTSNTLVEDDAYNVQIEQLVYEDLHELRELHMEIDKNIISIINSSADINEDFSVIIEKFNRYSSILTYYNFFMTLSTAMKSFVLILHENPFPEDKETIFMLLESFLYVLEKWQNELESGNKEMINFFDASIINDMTTISNMWIKSSDKEEDFGEMEFF